jgi:hypothetical protein
LKAARWPLAAHPSPTIPIVISDIVHPPSWRSVPPV